MSTEALRERLDRIARGDPSSGADPPLEDAGDAAEFEAAIIAGPEPALAAGRATRLVDAPFARAGGSLGAALHQGGYLARLVNLVPDFDWRADGPLQVEAMRDRIDTLASRSSIADAIGRVRTEAYIRLGLLELEGAPLEAVAGPLGDLVAACTGAALAAESLEADVVVFAMGKLAGQELNFLSDVDLVFAHHDHPDDDHPARGHARRTRLFGRLRNVLRSLEGCPPWQPVFRLDLRLRPFGTRGPLSLSASAIEQYYERHGRSWERQVWLRARPMAGDIELGREIQRRLSPFVYPRTTGPDIMEEIGAVMRRGRREARRTGLAGGFDVKLDRGGIREIEFFVQALQRLHGGRDSSVRSQSTLGAIDRLAAAGHLSDREHSTLGNAYRWLRRVEHRLQIAEGQQTHRLPVGEAELDRLGRRLHASGHLPAPDALLDELGRVTRSVCATTATLDDDIEPLVRETRHRRDWGREVVLDPGAPARTRRRALEELGLADPDEAGAVVEHLLRRRDSPFSDSGPARRGAETLLLACLDTADPDDALRRLAAFCSLRPPHYAAWRQFARPEHSEVVKRVADLFGASEPLSRGLIGFPNARGVADEGSLNLLARATNPVLPTAESIHDELELRLAEHPADHPAELDRELLRFLHDQLVIVGLHDLANRPESVVVGAALSDLADAIVHRVTADATTSAPHLTLGVFGLGKLGERGMDYGSDLDLMFVFDAADARAVAATKQQATAICRAIRSRLDGTSAAERLYTVDMRLRPSGQQGLLVTSLAGFAAYHSRAIPVWERLALCRARPVAVVGPRAGALSSSVAAIVERSVFERQTPPETLRAEVRSIRARIEREIARETRTKWNAKTGRGGAMEVELLVGALQLLHPTSAVRATRATLDALKVLGREGVVDEADARALSAAYRFHRLLMNRLRMRHGSQHTRDPDRFDVNSPRLSVLARRMGLADRDTFLGMYDRHRQAVRSAFDRLL